MNSHRITMAIGVLMLLSSLTATAAVPPFINFQGRMTDPAGDPVADGIYSVVFTIWDAPVGGNAVWTSDPTSVSVAGGLFTSIVGIIPSSVFEPARDLFVGVTVGADPEMTPRVYILTIPFAYHSETADRSNNCPAWTINGADIYRPAGAVGIGEAHPQTRLVIGSNLDNITFAGVHLAMRDDDPDGIAGITMGEDFEHRVSLTWGNTDNSFRITQATGTASRTLLVGYDGHVGIGIWQPDFMLHVKSQGVGDGLRVDSYASNQLFRVRENSDGSCEIQTSDNTGAVTAMIRGNGDSYFTGGDVGIGTTTPNYTLDVRGTIGNYTTLYHSDRRWKTDIRPLNDALASILQLHGVSYQWNREDFPDMKFPDGRQIGLIAQDVEEVVPEVVHTADDGYKSIEYAKLIAVLTEAIKTQQEQIEILNTRLTELEQSK